MRNCFKKNDLKMENALGTTEINKIPGSQYEPLSEL